MLTVPAISTLYKMLDPAMFELNGKGYVVGSMTDPGTFSGGAGTFEFDPGGSSFVSKAGCGCGNMGYSAFVLNNLAYLNVNNTCSDTTFVYTFDPIGNSWLPSDPIAFTDSADLKLGFAVNGKGYLGYGSLYNSFCGLNGGHSRLYEYSPSGTNISQANKPEVFELYPNPAQDRITVRCRNKNRSEQYILRNSLGEEMLRFSIPSGEDNFNLDVSQLAKGIYLLCSEDGSSKRKIVVER